jgi:hypothetical protein
MRLKFQYRKMYRMMNLEYLGDQGDLRDQANLVSLVHPVVAHQED